MRLCNVFLMNCYSWWWQSITDVTLKIKISLRNFFLAFFPKISLYHYHCHYSLNLLSTVIKYLHHQRTLPKKKIRYIDISGFHSSEHLKRILKFSRVNKCSHFCFTLRWKEHQRKFLWRRRTEKVANMKRKLSRKD